MPRSPWIARRLMGLGPLRTRLSRRVTAAAAVTMALAATAFAPAPAASAATCTANAMYIAAHAPDSLLFESPDLLHDVQAHACVTAVFLTADDLGNGHAYWSNLE